MDPQLRFGLSIVLSFLTWGLVAKYYFWPALHAQPGRTGFRPILLLHAFRFVGLAFLVPGVVSPDLPVAFAVPAAYGDLVTALLALATLRALEKRIGLSLLWVFNLLGCRRPVVCVLPRGHRGRTGARQPWRHVLRADASRAAPPGDPRSSGQDAPRGT